MIILFILLVFVVIYTYVLYPVILLLILRVKGHPSASLPSLRSGLCGTGGSRGKEKEEINPAYRVSMVVAAYNEEKVIKAKIENFLVLDYPEDKIELLIGSDGSGDGTNEAVKSFLNGRIRFFEFNERRGKAAVLNDIVKEAKGEITVFSDADTMYDRRAIGNLVRHFTKTKVGGVCGKLTLDEAGDSLAGEGLYWRYENYIKEKESLVKTIVGINGQIFAVRKRLFEPFPEGAITEDQVLGMKILSRGYDILFDKDAIAREEIGSPEEEFERRVRISAGNFQSIAYSLKILDPRAGFKSFALWSHKILRWLAPFVLIAIFLVNLFLLKAPFFKFLFLAQIGFYLISAAYYVLTKFKGRRIGILNAVTYFSLMNLAIIMGFVRFITKRQKAAWKIGDE